MIPQLLDWGMGTFCPEANAASWSFSCSFSAIAATALAVGERSAGLRNCRTGVADGVASSSKSTSMSPCRARVQFFNPHKSGRAPVCGSTGCVTPCRCTLRLAVCITCRTSCAASTAGATASNSSVQSPHTDHPGHSTLRPKSVCMKAMVMHWQTGVLDNHEDQTAHRHAGVLTT